VTGQENVQAKLAAVEEIGSAVQSFAQHAEQSAEQAMTVAKQFERHVCDEHGQRVDELRRAQSAREAAAAALRVCTENCAALKQALAEAERAVAFAVMRAETSAKAVAQVGEALQDFGEARRIFDVAVQTYGPRARTSTEQLSSQLQQYLGSGSGGARNESGRSQGDVGSGSHASVVMRSLEDVDLRKVINDRSDAPGFEKVSRSHVEWGLDSLKSVVEPALKMGKGPEYFTARDNAEGLSGERSYSGVYNWFYNTDHAIKLTQSSGGYMISNGYHRLAVARELGIDTLPAVVR
jgi:uncharacterized protein YoxC